jgi:hypothetical protein
VQFDAGQNAVSSFFCKFECKVFRDFYKLFALLFIVFFVGDALKSLFETRRWLHIKKLSK